jgi:hypothetical protein
MTATAAVVLCLPPAALAADKGVSVDPNSPSGKEYALPIDRARDRAAAGTDDDVRPNTTRPTGQVPLFGVGVTARKSKRTGHSVSKAVPAKQGTSRGTDGSEAADSAPAPAGPAPAAAPGGSSMVGVIVLAAALMLGGGAIGTALRRR